MSKIRIKITKYISDVRTDFFSNGKYSHVKITFFNKNIFFFKVRWGRNGTTTPVAHKYFPTTAKGL